LTVNVAKGEGTFKAIVLDVIHLMPREIAITTCPKIG
jgi:hypothetical protein